MTWRRLGAGRERGAAGPGGRDDAFVGGELGRRRYERGFFEDVEVSFLLLFFVCFWVEDGGFLLVGMIMGGGVWLWTYADGLCVLQRGAGEGEGAEIEVLDGVVRW